MPRLEILAYGILYENKNDYGRNLNLIETSNLTIESKK
jgi:hypothetical protein